MNQSINNALWKQFGASIDMLENAIQLCPDSFWDTEKKFWYNAYHCLFWLDYYLTTEPASFAPPAPFTLSEFDPAGAMPPRIYTKEELLHYLHASRQKCRQLIGGLTADGMTRRWVNDYKNYPVIEILLYNMRHVQHHAAQLNLLLRQETQDAPRWVAQTGSDV
jgi:hypothetical protein